MIEKEDQSLAKKVEAALIKELNGTNIRVSVLGAGALIHNGTLYIDIIWEREGGKTIKVLNVKLTNDDTVETVTKKLIDRISNG